MTMINRAAPQASPRLALDDEEIALLDRLRPVRSAPGEAAAFLGTYLIQIARLGGDLARSHDPPPGNIVIWRGWSHLMDIKTWRNAQRTDLWVIGSLTGCLRCTSQANVPVLGNSSVRFRASTTGTAGAVWSLTLVRAA